MHFHDTRGEYTKIAKFLEESEIEVDWPELMASEWWCGPPDWVPPPKWSMPEPYPRPLSSQIVTNYILSQANYGLEIRLTGAALEGKLTNGLAGGAGVDAPAATGGATGPSPWKNFLLALARQEHLHLKLITGEERIMLRRMALIEEELQRREVLWNRERCGRQRGGKSAVHVSRWGEVKLRKRAGMGRLEAIEELDRRGLASVEELRKWWAEYERKRDMSVFTRGGKVKKEDKGQVEVKGVEDRWRELKIERIGPNPRILTCSYEANKEVKRVLVRVKATAKFRVGMVIRMEEPEGTSNDPWEYSGKLPRFPGRW